jgi:prepilin-type N-terminal cleavage/methylation domain-containing protein
MINQHRSGFTLIEVLLSLGIFAFVIASAASFMRASGRQLAIESAKVDSMTFESLLRGQIQRTARSFIIRPDGVSVSAHCVANEGEPLLRWFDPPEAIPAGSPRFWAKTHEGPGNPIGPYLFPWVWFGLQASAAARAAGPQPNDSNISMARIVIDRCLWQHPDSVYEQGISGRSLLPHCLFLQNFQEYHTNDEGYIHRKFVIAKTRAFLWDYSLDQQIDAPDLTTKCNRYDATRSRGIKIRYSLSWNAGVNPPYQPGQNPVGVILRAKSGIVDLVGNQ